MIGSPARRIAVVGAESTGTTTLARSVADALRAPCVPEYGREYAIERIAAGATGAWRTREVFLHIAAEQARQEDQAQGEVVVCDTELLCVATYAERYTGAAIPEIEAMAAARRYDLYVLTLPDIPFTPDAIRDDGRREWMTQRLRERILARSEPLVEAGGSREQRLRTVLDFWAG